MNRRHFLAAASAGGAVIATQQSLANEPPPGDETQDNKKLGFKDLTCPEKERIKIIEVMCNGRIVESPDDTYTVNPGKIEVKTKPQGDSGTIMAIVQGVGTSTGGVRPTGSEYVTWDPYEILGADQRLSIPDPENPLDVVEATLHVVPADGRNEKKKAATWKVSFDGVFTMGIKPPLILRTSGTVHLDGSPVSTAINLALVPPDKKQTRVYQVYSDELGRWVKTWLISKGKHKLFVKSVNKQAKGAIEFDV